MAWSTPPTFTAGNVVTEAQMDIISDDLTFLGGPPRCRVYNSAAITGIVTATRTALTFNSERFDTDTMHSTATNTGRITATTAGTYHIGAHIEWEANGTGDRELALRVDGTTFIAIVDSPTASAGEAMGQSINTIYALTAGQYVEVVVKQTSGANRQINAVGNLSPEFWAHLVAVA